MTALPIHAMFDGGMQYTLNSQLIDNQTHFFKQKTAYEILRSDWSSDVCSSD
eukprot:COSAG01_NODE_64912_length_275_cov_0.517045_1_plen_51_part_01